MVGHKAVVDSEVARAEQNVISGGERGLQSSEQAHQSARALPLQRIAGSGLTRDEADALRWLQMASDPDSEGPPSDWTVIEGKRDQLVGRVQERYGIAKDEAEKQVAEFERNYENV